MTDDLRTTLEAVGERFNLGEYEIEAYLAVLDHGELTASAIADRTEIPQPRVYDTVRSLSDRGLVERGLDSSLDVCTYITPVHAQAPDIEAAIRLVETVAEVYDFGIDPAPLEAFAAEVEQYYAGLAEQLEDRDRSTDDRMYM